MPQPAVLLTELSLFLTERADALSLRHRYFAHAWKFWGVEATDYPNGVTGPDYCDRKPLPEATGLDGLSVSVPRVAALGLALFRLVAKCSWSDSNGLPYLPRLSRGTCSFRTVGQPSP